VTTGRSLSAGGCFVLAAIAAIIHFVLPTVALGAGSSVTLGQAHTICQSVLGALLASGESCQRVNLSWDVVTASGWAAVILIVVGIVTLVTTNRTPG
jgi:hypothetical protein